MHRVKDSGVRGSCRGCGCELTLLYDKGGSLLYEKRSFARWVDVQGSSLCPSDALIFHTAPREQYVAPLERFSTLKGFLRILGRNHF